MSDMFIANGYKNQLNSQAFGVTGFTAEDYTAKLFSNNATVSDTTAVGGLTEASFSGYAAVSVPRSTLVAALSGNTSYLLSSVVPQYTNTSGGSTNVYGWYLVGVTSGLLVCSQNFTSPPLAIPAGQTVTLYPFQIGLQSY